MNIYLKLLMVPMLFVSFYSLPVHAAVSNFQLSTMEVAPGDTIELTWDFATSTSEFELDALTTVNYKISPGGELSNIVITDSTESLFITIPDAFSPGDLFRIQISNGVMHPVIYTFELIEPTELCTQDFYQPSGYPLGFGDEEYIIWETNCGFIETTFTLFGVSQNSVDEAGELWRLPLATTSESEFIVTVPESTNGAPYFFIKAENSRGVFYTKVFTIEQICNYEVVYPLPPFIFKRGETYQLDWNASCPDGIFTLGLAHAPTEHTAPYPSDDIALYSMSSTSDKFTIPADAPFGAKVALYIHFSHGGTHVTNGYTIEKKPSSGGGGGGGGTSSKRNTDATPQVLGVSTTTGASSTTSTKSSTPASTDIKAGVFYRNLTVWMEGEDVRALQKFLNSQGFTVALTGPGAQGNETTYFGLLTQAALAKFQSAYGIDPAVGYFGPITLAKVVSLLK